MPLKCDPTKDFREVAEEEVEKLAGEPGHFWGEGKTTLNMEVEDGSQPIAYRDKTTGKWMARCG